MALQKEIWINHLVENLFPDNSFMAHSYSADDFVYAGRKVHIPNAGAKQTASVGPIARPKVAKEMTDTELSFDIQEIYTDPIYIPNADKYELSYDKREAVLKACRGALLDKLAETLLKAWTPTEAARKVKLQGATFSRKDVLKAQTLLNKDEMPQEGRCLLLDADAYEQLLEDLSEAQANAFLASADTSRGVIGKLYGFEVMLRSKLITGTSALAWHRDYVCRAKGESEAFIQENDPLYYGDVLSFLVRAGGSRMQKDGIGTVAFEKGSASA